jgi:hypothetical protein
MAVGATEVDRDIKPTPAYDAFWIFTLWRALHGDDAMLADIAAEVIANLSQYLPIDEDSFGVAPLPPSSSVVAVSGLEYSESTDDTIDARHEPAFFCSDPAELSIYHNYFSVKGVFYRIDRPAFACLPTAA